MEKDGKPASQEGRGSPFSILAGSPYAGISKTEIFGTTPYARALREYILGYEKAAHLGRKFRVGFSSELSDENNCGIQDLGLMAMIQEGERGFKLYGGGGLGRGGLLGLVLVPFLPAERALQAVIAAIDLFYDHGDLENNPRARLRFVREKLGAQGYRALYHEYLSKTSAPLLEELPEIDYCKQAGQVKVFQDAVPDHAAYQSWLQRAVQETKFDNVVAVRLYMRRTRFTAAELRILGAILKKIGAPGIRLTTQQDAIIPFVHRSALPVLYCALRDQLPQQVVLGSSFTQQVVACVGARICTRGLVESPAAAEEIADALDELFVEYADIRDEVFAGILDGIKVSGCGNSCGVNQIAAIGFHGHRRKINGVLTDILLVHIGGDISEEGHYFALASPEWWIKADDIGPFVAAIVKEYLDDYRAGHTQSLRQYMVGKRESFDIAHYEKSR